MLRDIHGVHLLLLILSPSAHCTRRARLPDRYDGFPRGHGDVEPRQVLPEAATPPMGGSGLRGSSV